MLVKKNFPQKTTLVVNQTNTNNSQESIKLNKTHKSQLGKK